MRRRLVLAVALLALALVLVPVSVPAEAASASASASAQTLFTVADQRLDELSGIARGIASPGVFYVHNDSGDTARFFAIDATTGRVRAVYDVPAATNVDWEDLAVARDAAGTASVWLADIGDNDSTRNEVELYRVDEPRVAGASAPITTAAPEVWRLRYPDGPANAESLAVGPNGRAYVITKRPDGRSGVYAVPPHPSTGVQTMARIGAITFTASESLLPASLQRSATGAALSRDGTRLVVRTYSDAYVWRVRSNDLAAALRTPAVRIALPFQPQGEGICFDGDRLVLDSEGVGTAVLAVALPAATAPAPSTKASITSSAPSTSSAPGTSVAPPATTSQLPRKNSGNDAASTSLGPVVVIGGVLVAAIAGVATVLARRRRPRRG